MPHIPVFAPASVSERSGYALLLTAGGPHLPRWSLALFVHHSIFQAEPLGHLLRIETNGTSDMETGKRAASRHPVDVLVIYAKKFTEF
jgi:hypothetical protein